MMLTYRTWLWGVYACVNLLYLYDHDFLNDHVCLFCPLCSPLSLLTSLREQTWKAQCLPFTIHSGLLPPPQLIFVQIPSPLALTLVCKAVLSISMSLVNSSCSASSLLREAWCHLLAPTSCPLACAVPFWWRIVLGSVVRVRLASGPPLFKVKLLTKHSLMTRVMIVDWYRDKSCLLI